MLEKKPGKVEDPAAWLFSAISGNGLAKPKGFISKAERQQKAKEKADKDAAAAEERRQKQTAEANNRKERDLINSYWNALDDAQRAAHDKAAIAEASADELKLIEPGPMKRFGMTAIRDSFTRKILLLQGKLPITST